MAGAIGIVPQHAPSQTSVPGISYLGIFSIIYNIYKVIILIDENGDSGLKVIVPII